MTLLIFSNTNEMTLSNEQIVKLLEKPKNGFFVEEGRKYESRLRLYTESKSENDLKSEFAWGEYTRDLKVKLSELKYDKILKYINYPLSVVDISNSCLDELNKVFEARNSYFNEDFDNISNKKRLDPILNEMRLEKWITKHGKEVIKNKPNLIVVIDKDEKGNPYLVDIDSQRLIDFDLESEESAKLSYIIFLHSVQLEGENKVFRYSVYDEEYYRVYKKTTLGTFILESESKHTAGCCPARMFISDRLNSVNPYNRKIPFSNIVSKMKEWQNFDTMKYYTDHYAPFPVLEAPEQNCSVDGCISGIVYRDEYYDNDGVQASRQIFHDCPSCKSKDLIGPGTVIRIPPKLDKDDPSESGVFKMISNPVDTLVYIENKLDKLESHITFKTVGTNTMVQKEAINEMQVEGSYDSRQNVLLNLKKNFDLLYIWVVNTTTKLVNPNAKVRVSADFGTEFYLLDEDDLQERFNKAKEIGLPESEVDSIFKQLVYTKYKGNKQKIEKALLLNYLDPFPYKSIEEVINLVTSGIISKRDLILKLELIKFVDRFEYENGSIVEFGIELEPYKKVEKVMQIFNKYIDEKSKIEQV